MPKYELIVGTFASATLIRTEGGRRALQLCATTER